MRIPSISWRRPGLAAISLLGVLPLAMTLTASAMSSSSTDVAQPLRASWESLWLSGTSPSTYTTTLKDIRTMIGASTGTGATLTGKGVGVALIDTGVAPVAGIPAANLINGPDLSFESQSDDLRYLDGYGHGTHLAGIISANDAATGTLGLAPEAKLTSIKVGTANGAVDVSQLIAAIDWVVEHRFDDPANPIRVLNLSYGSAETPDIWTNDPLQYAVEQAWRAGIVVVAATGNEGRRGYTQLDNPAHDPWVIAVGSTRTQGTVAVEDDTVADYTNISSSRPIDLLAPGDSVASLRVPGSNIDNTFPAARIGDALFKGTGTSQAAAITSAAAALLIQQYPWLFPDFVKAYLVRGATWLPRVENGRSEVNVNGAIKAVKEQMLNPQSWPKSDGSGSIEKARGSSHVVSGTSPLTGENTIVGSFDARMWAAKSGTHESWSGGTWMGHRLAGDDWSGKSWASKTWASAEWPGKPWAGGETWKDENWIGRYWIDQRWAPGEWIGHYWSTDRWSSSRWG